MEMRPLQANEIELQDSAALASQRSPIRIGMIGTGRVAHRFVSEAKAVQGKQLVGAYNPDAASARAFVQSVSHFTEPHMFGSERAPLATDNLDELLACSDAIYVASPHQYHYEQVKTALRAGKHVLCEKPLAFSEEQARDLYSCAADSGLVLLEDVKTAYFPGFEKLVSVVKSGAIGEVRDIESAFSRLTPSGLRERDDSKFGGSFLEFGTYGLLPAIRLFGIERVMGMEALFHVQRDERDVDVYAKAFLRGEDATALVKTGLGVKTEGQLLVSGTQGYVLAPSPWWLTTRFEVRHEDPNDIQVYEAPLLGAGLRYVLDNFIQLINGEEGVKPKLLPEESIAMASVIQKYLEAKASL